MAFDGRVIVVGTTPDYVTILHNRYGSRCLFIMDNRYRSVEELQEIDKSSLLFCNFEMAELVARPLLDHLSHWKLRPSGIACYDCEWLLLSSWLAEGLGLPFSSMQSVTNCRDKYRSKILWQEGGVDCPKVRLVRGEEEAIEFAASVDFPIVLKPISGSGSELIFRCHHDEEVGEAVEQIRKGLHLRADSPFYRKGLSARSDTTWRDYILAEQFIGGREFSCDIRLRKGEVELFRTAQKEQMKNGGPFGTTTAYTCPVDIPVEGGNETLRRVVARAASVLGLRDSWCMVDFKVESDRIVILELTPRPGGDCLPALVEHCSGSDVLGLALDFAEGKDTAFPNMNDWDKLVGLRLLARRRGTIRSLDVSMLENDSRVREVYLKVDVGHKVQLPPRDYSSWVLGHVVFHPRRFEEVAGESEELANLMKLELEPFHADKDRSHSQPLADFTESCDSSTQQ